MPIPKLQGRNLRLAVRAFERLPMSSKTAVRTLQAMLIEAATPDRGDPARLAQGPNIIASQQKVIDHTRSVMARVREVADLPLDDDAWLDEMERKLSE